jgi:hypothetical protein
MTGCRYAVPIILQCFLFLACWMVVCWRRSLLTCSWFAQCNLRYNLFICDDSEIVRTCSIVSGDKTCCSFWELAKPGDIVWQ